MDKTPGKVLRNQHLEKVASQSTPIKIPASPLMKNLGYGTYVNVYKLDRSPRCGQIRSPWAVKRISRRARGAGKLEYNKRIQEESDILRKLTHPNIVGFRGIQKSEDGMYSLLLECCQTCLGTILENRFEDDLGALPAKNTIKMIFDICKALDFLHNEAKLLHGDLKSSNILVHNDFEICKLCDFGVSLPLDENGFINFDKNPEVQYVGTAVWLAPEVIDVEDVIDAKADIFSFGLTIYETISLCPPHTIYISDEDSKESFKDESLDCSGIERAYGTRPPLPQAFEFTAEYNKILEIFYYCTNEAAEDRPSAKEIWVSLENSFN
ncbi:lymphokine-activated killer T-cell-originated protein kinase-like [Episyrphus balteatus]|uniref:lymphokine-activated killer T-cell-originated protein kinase-like n=1 Tax=Episyrphus balteatus TaxID=286459 RepID=UPI002485D61D|nr:lymphokine-activated killer T-cell-originated protein kinase-like [Episyrphus balteatus]